MEKQKEVETKDAEASDLKRIVRRKAEWKLLPDGWGENCLRCGNDVEILTSRDNLEIAYENEKIKCCDKTCSAKGVIRVDCDIAYVEWNELIYDGEKKDWVPNPEW